MKSLNDLLIPFVTNKRGEKKYVGDDLYYGDNPYKIMEINGNRMTLLMPTRDSTSDYYVEVANSAS